MLSCIKRISIFGDSIMKGLTFNSEKKRYMISDSLGLDSLAKTYSLSLTNRARIGSTIDKGEEILKKSFNAGEDADAVFLEFGGNDCDFNWKEISETPLENHLPKTPIDMFEEKYYKIIDYLKSRGVMVIMANLPPISSERYLDWVCRNGLSKDNIMMWLGDENAIYRYQETYSRKVEEIARTTNTPLINLRDAFLKNRKINDYLCADGIHPNEKGQKIINNELSSALNEWKAALPVTG